MRGTNQRIGIRFVGIRFLAAASLAVLFAFGATAEAAPVCSTNTYSSLWWADCDSAGSYIILGSIYDDADNFLGIGICVYTQSSYFRVKVSYQERHIDTAYMSHLFYQINAGDGDDTIKLAETDADGEACGGDGYWIRGRFHSSYNAHYDMNGDDGNDHIWLCSKTSPSASDCANDDNDATADGGDDNDYVYGTYWDDSQLSGGPGTDYVFGNGGDDSLYGYGGIDRLYGGDGCDELYGGDGNDYCWCEGEGGVADSCINPPDCDGCD